MLWRLNRTAQAPLQHHLRGPVVLQCERDSVVITFPQGGAEDPAASPRPGRARGDAAAAAAGSQVAR
eukprot:CAMPEP_0204555284 /NCGR_PEP_ID=MMETSP0661-20131031/28729_1 /ASSEMBLY_ACC=CAM_ASM_000606 /TAXON_ID=109239 /ORGANISM="Alexandrium margalefi, Strain AMGDE01CS-322" /LENGTH=66 /DNA_ID=CAMNT_0051562373 /DNA_START=143 /DNA_END=339 /DNA_ORIENTATION=+